MSISDDETRIPDWAERIAEDPKGTLRELAESRGMTVEELETRHNAIAALSIEELDELLERSGVNLSKDTQ